MACLDLNEYVLKKLQNVKTPKKKAISGGLNSSF